MSPTIFVVAATGTIGKAVALDLRGLGWNVHATVRDPTSPAARELAAAGVKLFPGDWDNEKSLLDGMAGCDGLFLNLIPTFTDFEADVRQGKTIIGAAKAAGVKQLVHSTGIVAMAADGRFEPASGIAVFLENKRRVEDAARAAGFEAYTILRPAAFMANWLAPKVAMYPGLAEAGAFETAYRPDTVLPLVDERDVAAFAAAAFRDPARFHLAEIEVASEARTVEDILALLSRAVGREIEARYLPDAEIADKGRENIYLLAQLGSRSMIDYFDMGDMPRWGISLHTFAEYLEREKKSVERTYSRIR